MALPKDAADRKDTPIVRGVLDFFPDAIAEVARVSLRGSQQHHPDAAMHWDKGKSTDEADALVRHLVERGTLDTDGMRHTAKVAWRALAMLQRELDVVNTPRRAYAPGTILHYDPNTNQLYPEGDPRRYGGNKVNYSVDLGCP